MRRLRIGILGTRGIPNHYGGFEQFAEYLSLGLVQRGHDVFVYSSAQHSYQQRAWNDVQIIHCKDPESSLGTFGQFIYDLNCINDARKRDFDVLLHLGYTSDSVWHWKWPKTAVNMVNMDGMEWRRSKYNKLTQRFLKWAEALAAKHAGLLIADSPHMQEYLAGNYGKRAVYIPYGAELFAAPEAERLKKYQLEPRQYFLLVARLEPENNIEMVIRGYLESNHPDPLLIIGDTRNQYGNYLRKKYKQQSVRFVGAIYDQPDLNNLRYYSAKYFHGHSVGGTNPSLLEAMACGCDIAANNNVFNKAILQQDADYFGSAGEVSKIIGTQGEQEGYDQRKKANLEKIRLIYNKEKNIDDYEQLMFLAASKGLVPEKPVSVIGSFYRTVEKPG